MNKARNNSDRRLHLVLVGNTDSLHSGLHAIEGAAGKKLTENSTPQLYWDYADLLEAANFTGIFLADTAGAAGNPIPGGGAPEPITALAAIAARTKNLGLIGTASTTFYEPYNIARLFGSLDLISDGRAGWNAVTTAFESVALNYNQEKMPDRDSRYDRAYEFVDVVRSLWSNRELRAEAHGGIRLFGDPLDHEGEHFRVKGPLNVAPSRQGRPFIGQAGGSTPGIKLAAKYADATFTNANSKEDALEHLTAVDQALIEYGRPAGSMPILPMIMPFLGATTKEAEDRRWDVDSQLNYETIAPTILSRFGLSYSYDSIEEPFPLDSLPHPDEVRDVLIGAWANYRGMYTWIHAHPGVTIKQVAAQTSQALSHRKFVGSYDEFADDMVEWYDEGLVNGFLLMAPLGLESVKSLTEEVVPRLVDRGVYWDVPDERPLRERFPVGPSRSSGN